MVWYFGYASAVGSVIGIYQTSAPATGFYRRLHRGSSGFHIVNKVKVGVLRDVLDKMEAEPGTAEIHVSLFLCIVEGLPFIAS